MPHAAKLIARATTYQEFDVEQKKNITYWGLIAIIDGQKIKVVLRKIGNGNVHFWSVFPQWITSKRRDEKFFKENHQPKTPH